MRVRLVAAMIALMAGTAYAQSPGPVPRYGEAAKDKSRQEIAAEKEDERAYKRSPGNIPDQAPTDPWGNVRSESPPKPVAKASSAKRTKTEHPAN